MKPIFKILFLSLISFTAIAQPDKTYDFQLDNADVTLSLHPEPPDKSGQVFEGLKGSISYEQTVSMSTKKINDKVEIKVSDNGNGIPQKVLDKIFQPFFTTKPTGQGTGLGLSLSYDIVKAHGGELTVEPKENEGSTFIVVLPTID